MSKVSVLLRQLNEQMTKGPWRYEEDNEGCAMGWIFGPDDPYPQALFVVCGDSAQQAINAEGIAEARNLLLSAAEEIEQLEQQQGRMPEVCEKLVAAEQKVEQLEKQRDEASQQATRIAHSAVEILTSCGKHKDITFDEFLATGGKSCPLCQFARAEAAESRLREMDWIPVSERFPESDPPGSEKPTVYLTANSDDDMEAAAMIEGDWVSVDGRILNNVTRWAKIMPLPLPPSDSKANIR